MIIETKFDIGDIVTWKTPNCEECNQFQVKDLRIEATPEGVEREIYWVWPVNPHHPEDATGLLKFKSEDLA